jgi:hypothetical protein
LYCPANTCIMMTIKSRRMKWVDHVAGMGEIRNAYGILIVKL